MIIGGWIDAFSDALDSMERDGNVLPRVLYSFEGLFLVNCRYIMCC